MSSDFSSNVILLFAFKILFVTIRYSGALIIDLFMCRVEYMAKTELYELQALRSPDIIWYFSVYKSVTLKLHTFKT